MPRPQRKYKGMNLLSNNQAIIILYTHSFTRQLVIILGFFGLSPSI